MFNLVKNYVLDDDVSQLDALSWFRDIMSTNQNCIAYALAMSMRFILGYILEAQNKVDQTEAIGRDKEEFDLTTKSYYIKDFCRYLQIAIILNSKHTESYYNKNTETVPAVYLYCAQNE